MFMPSDEPVVCVVVVSVTCMLTTGCGIGVVGLVAWVLVVLEFVVGWLAGWLVGWCCG